MRLFTGLSIPSPVVSALECVLRELRGAAGLKWSPAENLHITTKFIGEWAEERLSEIQEALEEMDPPGEFEVTVAGFGFLPNARKPKILMAEVRGEMGLAALASRADAALGQVGVKREARPYTPHVTLARIGNDGDIPLPDASVEFGSFTAREFHLYASRRDSAGSVYSILASYPLQKTAGGPGVSACTPKI